jgi:hypothetical protein
MASPGPKAVGYLELNVQGFDQAIKTAKNMLGGLAASFAAFKAGEFFKDGIKDAIDFGKEMQSASRAMGGFDPGNILLAQKALEKAGMGAQEAQGHIQDFITEGRDVAELFGGADNYAKALKSAAADYGEQASVLSRSGKALQTVWNTMESVGSKVQTFFLSMTEQFVQPLQVVLDYINQLDLAGVGEAFGKYIADAANSLVGLLKNGDLYESIQLGLTIAFKESVNYLVGGLNYIGNMTIPFLGEQLSKAFLVAAELLSKALDFIFSSEGLQAFVDGIVGVSAKFIEAILNGLNTVFRVMQAGVQMAVQAAIDAIPGARTVLGMGGVESQSFGQLYEQTSGIVPQDLIDTLGKAGDDLVDRFGDKFADFTSGMIKPGEAGAFEKANVFRTEDDKKKFGELISKANETAAAMGGKAGENQAPTKGVLTSFSGSSSRVIADSLAKVGGGGGFLRVGMSLQEKTALQQLNATKQNGKALDAIAKNTEPKPRPTALGRGR